ncbi:YHYH domain-containing protein [Pseudomonas sp. NPDC089554]
MKIVSLVIAALLSFSSVAAFAHSGGTDAQGCHTNHKTGERHCH